MNTKRPFLSNQTVIANRMSGHVRDFHSPRSVESGIATGLSRRKFLQTTAGAATLALAPGLWTPQIARAGEQVVAQPRPIPGGVSPLGIFIHHFPALPTGTPLQSLSDPSQIGDFSGFVGINRIRGAGTGSGFATPLAFQADMGFMKGVYIGDDGEHHHGAFAFI
jgi:hypothetical protein